MILSATLLEPADTHQAPWSTGHDPASWSAVGSITEHLGQRNQSSNTSRATLGLLIVDLAATAVQVADNVAHVLIRHDNIDLHDGLHDDGIALLHASLNAIEPAMENAISEESTS